MSIVGVEETECYENYFAIDKKKGKRPLRPELSGKGSKCYERTLKVGSDEPG